MEGVFFIVFAVIVLLSPWIEAEDRPDFLRPNRKARQAVGTWFSASRPPTRHVD
jgi:hypothetical protein